MIQFHELPACARNYRQPALENAVGLIPMFIDERDPRSAREQFNERYAHGGGWRPFEGFVLQPGLMARDRDVPAIRYPGDPSLPPLTYAFLRDELIVVYPSAWVGIFQPDGSFEISRLD